MTSACCLHNCYIIINEGNVESLMQLVEQCALRKISSCVGNLVLHVLQFNWTSIFQKFRGGGTSICYYRSHECCMESQCNIASWSVTFEWGVYSNKCSEGLGFDHFDELSPCSLLIEYYSQIFYTIYKCDVQSIQCKRRLKSSNLMREVDCLYIVFINIYVPESCTTLPLSVAHAVVFSEDSPPCILLHTGWCHRQGILDIHHYLGSVIYVHIVQCRGEDRTEQNRTEQNRTEPYGTPACIILGVNILPSTETQSFLFERKELMS
jgi:hypothetical protein